MTKKPKDSKQEEKQLSLFEDQDDLKPEQAGESHLTPPTPLPYEGRGESGSPLLAGEGLGERFTQPDSDDNWLEDEDFGFDAEPSDRTIETSQTLLTLQLLQEAIEAQNPDDPVMRDFGAYVLPKLLQLAIGVTAKGGKFFDKIDQEREATGKEKVRRDNAADQSLNTHLLNGLFPANLIEKRLEKLDTTIQRVVGERERRLVMAAFILHDFEKFPDVPENCRKLSIAEHRQIIERLVHQLRLDSFINPEEPEAYQEYLDDLLCMAYNAQRRWDTNWNFSEFGLNPTLSDRTLSQLSDLFLQWL